MRPIVLAPLLAGCGMSFLDEEAPHALSFSGEPSCVQVDLGAHAFPAELTIEGWIQAAESVDYGDHPFVVWTGAFSLYQDADGIAHIAEGNGAGGASWSGEGWMDGALHHVAATWDGADATLFVDGERVAFAPAALGQDPDAALYIGCWGSNAVHHEGIIDEVRLSEAVLYDESFEVEALPFEATSRTLGLWHFDEGEGEVSLDATGGEDAVLTAVEWVEFRLGRDGDTGEQ